MISGVPGCHRTRFTETQLSNLSVCPERKIIPRYPMAKFTETHLSSFISIKIQVRLEGKLIFEKPDCLRIPFTGMKLLILSVTELEAETFGGRIHGLFK